LEEEQAISHVRQSYVHRGDDTLRYSSLKPFVLAQSAEKRRVLAKAVTEHLRRELSGSTILDIGCGDGRELSEFIWLGATPELLAGNDLQDDRLDAARKRLPASVRLEAGDIRRTSFETGTFDVVTLFVVLMTIKNEELRTAVLRHAYDLVKPEGLLIVSEPIIPNPRNKDVIRIRQSELVLSLGVKPIMSRRMYLVPPVSTVARFPTVYNLVSALAPFLKFHKLWVFRKV